MAESSHQKLYTRALKYLAQRSYSEGELADKLARFGSPEEVAQILAELKAINLVNDFDFARNFASYRVRNKRLGRFRAAQDLKKRKIAEPVIERALDEVYTEVDEETLMDQAIEKWLRQSGRPKEAKELKRLVRFLQRQGFSSDRLYDKLSVYFAELGHPEDAAEEL